MQWISQQHFVTDLNTFCDGFQNILRLISEPFLTDFKVFCYGFHSILCSTTMYSRIIKATLSVCKLCNGTKRHFQQLGSEYFGSDERFSNKTRPDG